jgi:hypothetical protein
VVLATLAAATGLALATAVPALALASPTLTSTASGNTTVGLEVFDNVNLAGGSNPTGTVTFQLYGPGDPTCSGAVAFTSTVTVSGDGSYNSAHFTTTTPGTYQWVATYSGDAANNPVGPTSCSGPNESVIVSKFTPALSTTASPTTTTGGQIHDTATLTGRDPTGTITFHLSGPSDTFCGATPVFTATVTENTGSGSYDSPNYTPLVAGTYRWQASYSGDANNTAIPISSCLDGSESVVVTQGTPVTPTITTTASGPVTVGGAISDVAVISGGASPTGSVVFTVFGPNDATCSATAAATSTVPVSDNGTYTSAPFTTTAAGTYRFVVAYSGDAGNSAATSPCNSTGESVVVSASGPAAPAIATTASGAVAVGGAISDTAVISGGASPTGSVVFTVFGPNDATCAAGAAFTSTVPVSGNGSYASGPFTTAAAGTYRFVAAYSGDAGNSAATSPCNSAGESVVVTAGGGGTPTISTTASAPVSVGGGISDTAVLAGGSSPTGSITFRVFGPADASCTATPAFTSTATVSGDGSYSSGPFTTTAAGTYRFVASYSGDGGNSAVTSTCNDPGESVVVSAAGGGTPTISTTASAPVSVGGSISDTAVLAGGSSPTGSITFRLFGPGDATCSGAVAFTSTATVSGDGSYASGSFTTTAAGTYSFVASYGGDAGNSPAATACNDPGESVVVSAGAPATPTISTTASAPVTAGGTISDTAVLGGGSSPTGSITFTVFGPNDATCAATAAFTSTVPVAGDGSYSSGPFAATAAGTYRFVASYSGDAGNAGAISACNAAGEAVVVAQATPTLSTQASSGVALGGQLADAARLSGAQNPTGTVTFQLFGAGDPSCSAAPVFTSVKAVGSSGTIASDSVIAGSPGTYHWVATYGGDANNAGAATSCGDAAESTTVTRAQPTVTTRTAPALTTGGSSSDTATLTGIAPTGTLRFDLYGPNDAACGTPIFTATAPVSGNGDYGSGSFAITAAGAYSWVVTYSGDANNLPVASSCQSEPVAVSAPSAPPASTTPVTTPVAPPPPPPAPTITQVCAGIESQVDGQLPGQTIASDLAHGFAFNLSSPASIEVRVVLRAKNPADGSFVSLANFLLHVSSPVVASQPGNGLGPNYLRRARAFLDSSERALSTLLVFKVVHCRPDKQTVSSESVGILSLGP